MGATNSRASPEPERTVVTLPEENPEIEPLAGASERQGATTILRSPRSYQKVVAAICQPYCVTF